MIGLELHQELFPVSRSTASGLRALPAVEHRPTDVIPQALVVKYELANRPREMFALPLALELPCGLALSFRRGSTRGLDRIGGRTKLVRGDVCDDRRLAGSERGMTCCPTQVSAAAMAWPPAERAGDILISPRTQARACSIA